MFGSGFGSSSGTFSNNSGGGLFGNKSTSLFGTTTSQPSTGGLFGHAASTPTASSSLFGQTQQQQKPLFGASNTQSTLFGSAPTTSGTSTGGGLFVSQQQTSLFGTGAGFSTSAPVGTTIKFNPITGSDTMLRNGEQRNITTKNMCITAMKQYEGKSLEELRVEDYLANRKIPQTQVGGSLFGQSTQNSTTGQSLFGNSVAQNKPAGGLFSNGTNGASAFPNNTFSNTSFGGIKPATSQPAAAGTLFGVPKPSLFGTSTSQPSTGLFGQTASTSTPVTVASLFGQQQQKPLFGTATTQPNIFGNTQPATSGSLFGQPQAQQTSLFGATNTTGFGLNNAVSTANTLNKPFGTSFGSPATSAAPAFGVGTTGTNFFGSTQPKLNNTLFGTQPPVNNNFFGSNATSQPLFGNNMQKPGPFSTSTAQPPNAFVGVATNAFGTQPAAAGLGFGTFNATTNATNVNQVMISSRAQQEIIDSQLAALPYGDSPLLKTSVQKSTTTKANSVLQAQSPSTGAIGLQRQLKFLASKLDTTVTSGTEVTTTSVLSGSIASPSINLSMNRLPIAGADLNTSSLMNNSFSYKPLISLPSVGFGAALGLNSSSSFLNSPSSHSLRNRSFLAQNSELEQSSNGIGESSINSPKRPISGRNAKALDLSVIHKPSPQQDRHWTPVSQNDSNSKSVNKEVITSELATPITRKDKTLPDNQEVIVPKLAIDNANTAVLSPNISTADVTTEKNKSSDVLKDSPIFATPNLNNSTSRPLSSPNGEAKLLHSVTIEASSPGLNRPEYYSEPSMDVLRKCKTPEGKYKVDVGLTVGRRGYGSVFWRGPFELSNLNFDAIVHFRSKEVVVYPDESIKPLIGEELNRPAEVSLECIWPVEKGKVMKNPDDVARLQFRNKLEKLCERMCTEFRDYRPATGTWQFKVAHFSKYGFEEDGDDGEMLVDVKPLQFLKRPFAAERIIPDEEDIKRRVPVLIERPVVNIFRGLTKETLAESLLTTLKVRLSPECCNSRRSCRVGFGQNKTLMAPTAPGEYTPCIKICTISTILCIEEYLKRYLMEADRSNELPDFQRSNLLRWEPPSTLLKFIDSFIVQRAEKKDLQLDSKIMNMCEALLLPPSPSREIEQRILFGNWLRGVLISESEDNFNDSFGINNDNGDNKFKKIYKLLLNGAVRKATDAARDAHLYNLAMLISLFNVPPGPAVQSQVAEQLAAYRRLNCKKDIYYERILELLSGCWTPLRGQGDASILNDDSGAWLNALGVIIWYFAKPSVTLYECVQFYSEKFKI